MATEHSQQYGREESGQAKRAEQLGLDLGSLGSGIIVDDADDERAQEPGQVQEESDAQAGPSIQEQYAAKNVALRQADERARALREQRKQQRRRDEQADSGQQAAPATLDSTQEQAEQTRPPMVELEPELVQEDTEAPANQTADEPSKPALQESPNQLEGENKPRTKSGPRKYAEDGKTYTDDYVKSVIDRKKDYYLNGMEDRTLRTLAGVYKIPYYDDLSREELVDKMSKLSTFEALDEGIIPNSISSEMKSIKYHGKGPVPKKRPKTKTASVPRVSTASLLEDSQKIDLDAFRRAGANVAVGDVEEEYAPEDDYILVDEFDEFTGEGASEDIPIGEQKDIPFYGTEDIPFYGEPEETDDPIETELEYDGQVEDDRQVVEYDPPIEPDPEYARREENGKRPFDVDVNDVPTDEIAYGLASPYIETVIDYIDEISKAGPGSRVTVSAYEIHILCGQDEQATSGMIDALEYIGILDGNWYGDESGEGLRCAIDRDYFNNVSGLSVRGNRAATRIRTVGEWYEEKTRDREVTGMTWDEQFAADIENLDSLTKAQLKKLGTAMGVKLSMRMKKAEMVYSIGSAIASQASEASARKAEQEAQRASAPLVDADDIVGEEKAIDESDERYEEPESYEEPEFDDYSRDASDAQDGADYRPFDPYKMTKSWRTRRHVPKSAFEKMSYEEIVDEFFYKPMYKENRENLKSEYPNMKQPLKSEYSTWDETDKTGEVRKPTPREEKLRKLNEIADRNRDLFNHPWKLKIRGTSLREVAKDMYVAEYPPEVQAHLMSVARLYDMPLHNALQLVILNASIGIDSKGKMFNGDISENGLSVDEVIDICNAIEAAQNMKPDENAKYKIRHPMRLLPNSMRYKVGGTDAYPLGYIPSSLAYAMTQSPNSVLSGVSAAELVSAVQEEWLRTTQPTLNRNAHGVDKLTAQRNSILNMMRAMLELDDGVANASYWNVNEFEARMTLNDMYAEAAECSDDEMKQVLEQRARNAEKQLDNVYFRRREVTGDGKAEQSAPIHEVDENGMDHYYVLEPRHGRMQNLCSKIASCMRIMGILDPVIIGSGYLEHVVGNVQTIAANRMLGANIPNEFQMTNSLRIDSTGDEAKEAMFCLKLIVDNLGMPALKVFSTTGMALTPENVRKFCDKYRNRENQWKVSKVIDKIDEMALRAVPGDYGMQGCDSKRMMEMFLLNNFYAMKQGKPYVTAGKMEKAIRDSGVASVYLEMMSHASGTDAFVSMSNMNLGRRSAWTYLVEKAMRSNGVVELLLSNCIDKYIKYGVSAVQNLLPFSNTFAFLSIQGTKKDSEIRDYQLGGHDSFLVGLKKCMVYDLMKIGNFGAQACFCYIVIGLLGGLEDPEDEDNIFDYLSYVIGARRNPETGEIEYGYNVIPAWFMNDMVGWGFGAAVAMHVANNHPDDPLRAWGVFASSVYNSLDGSSVIDAIEFVTEWRRNIDATSKSIEDGGEPIGYDSYFKVLVGQGFAQFTKNMTPAFVNKYLPGITTDTMLTGPDAYDASTTTRYDVTEKVDGEEARRLNDTVYIDDFEDRMRRSASKRNLLLGIINNCLYNGQPFVGNDSEDTGYLPWEMPRATKADDRIMTSRNYMALDESKLPEDQEEREEYIDQFCSNLLQHLESEYGYPEKMLANGGFIEANARIHLTEYAYKQILLEKQMYNDGLKNGSYPTYADSVDARTRKDERVSYWYDVVDKWGSGNESLPWSDMGYVKKISDTMTTYEDESGNATTPWHYLADSVQGLFTGDYHVKKEMKPRGNSPTNFAPFTLVDYSPTDERGYNAETIPYWYDENLTDTQGTFDSGVGQAVPFGRNEGEYINDVNFGGEGQANVEDEYDIDPATGRPTIGLRSYVANPFAKVKPKAAEEATLENVAKKLGIDLEGSNSGKSSSGGSGSSYGRYARYASGGKGGSNSYSPKIYSNTRTVNFDRADTMGTRQPYRANVDYLRPGFATKGSREAYRRNEL